MMKTVSNSPKQKVKPGPTETSNKLVKNHVNTCIMCVSVFKKTSHWRAAINLPHTRLSYCPATAQLAWLHLQNKHLFTKPNVTLKILCPR